jgi:hypothetical protein
MILKILGLEILEILGQVLGHRNTRTGILREILGQAFLETNRFNFYLMGFLIFESIKLN